MELEDKIISELVFIRDNMVTKETFSSELGGVESRLSGQVEGFVKLHETLDHELISLRSKVDRLEERLGRLEAAVKVA